MRIKLIDILNCLSGRAVLEILELFNYDIWELEKESQDYRISLLVSEISKELMVGYFLNWFKMILNQKEFEYFFNNLNELLIVYV